MNRKLLVSRFPKVVFWNRGGIYPAILSKLDFRTSSPMLIMALPMTPLNRGWRLSIANAGPATAKINSPFSATLLVPKTGADINDACLSANNVDTCAEVSGCTVEQSTNTLFAKHSPAVIAAWVSSFRIWSFVICGSVRKPVGDGCIDTEGCIPL